MIAMAMIEWFSCFWVMYSVWIMDMVVVVVVVGEMLMLGWRSGILCWGFTCIGDRVCWFDLLLRSFLWLRCCRVI